MGAKNAKQLEEMKELAVKKVTVGSHRLLLFVMLNFADPWEKRPSLVARGTAGLKRGRSDERASDTSRGVKMMNCA